MPIFMDLPVPESFEERALTREVATDLVAPGDAIDVREVAPAETNPPEPEKTRDSDPPSEKVGIDPGDPDLPIGWGLRVG